MGHSSLTGELEQWFATTMGWGLFSQHDTNDNNNSYPLLSVHCMLGTSPAMYAGHFSTSPAMPYFILTKTPINVLSPESGFSLPRLSSLGYVRNQMKAVDPFATHNCLILQAISWQAWTSQIHVINSQLGL